MQTKSFSLPGGARVGVMVTILLEVWTDRAAPPYSPMTTALKPGTYDRAGVSWARYGLNNGVWRLTRILDSLGIKGTVCTSAKAIEQAPDTLRSVLQRGHEVAAHSYTQDTIVAYLSPAEELENMQRCIRIFEEHLQQRPAGWISPVLATTDRTTDFVCQEGFLWHGDYNDIDMPAIVTTEHGSTVALPHTDFADNRVLRLSPNALFDAYKGTFDYLYRQEPGSVVNLTVHCQFGGRPLISSQVYEILRYFQGFPDVWFARHDEMATWFKQTGAESIPYTDRFAVGGTQ
ncbi:MAG TPA: polysaccharide deacetylase family protein [Sphingomonadaceae bacterium]|nr:polysaccharide deacetylase family protein [Sphingomonadaceae bacterium]